MVANGAYLAYYNKEPNRLSKKVTVPNGVFSINKMVNIEKTKAKSNMFTFMYYNRLFEFQTAKPVETQMWVLCLNFLHKHS